MTSLRRIILAEDNALLREGLKAVLSTGGWQVIHAVDSADDIAPAVDEHLPDMLITDVRMPPHRGADGLRAAAAVRQAHPRLPVLVLSQYVERSYVSQLVDASSRAGFGYLLKDRVAHVHDFLDCLARVHAGGSAIDPLVVSQLIQHASNPLARLTPRELDVLALIAEGLSNQAIASRLFVSEPAVVKHVGNILTKLDLPPDGAQNRRVMAVLAYLDHGS
ncbi:MULTISPECIES: response regulator transcription factor [unclassified Luteococcus]|uniref:response regulator transcription factor n=1 Tax=unclassified Luteococcus TaxID=2639923 RepID=UPI00313DDDA2